MYVDGLDINAETGVKRLTILIGDMLKLEKHIDICCKNAAE